LILRIDEPGPMGSVEKFGVRACPGSMQTRGAGGGTTSAKSGTGSTGRRVASSRDRFELDIPAARLLLSASL
jgi:hypothetical protein